MFDFKSRNINSINTGDHFPEIGPNLSKVKRSVDQSHNNVRAVADLPYFSFKIATTLDLTLDLTMSNCLLLADILAD